MEWNYTDVGDYEMWDKENCPIAVYRYPGEPYTIGFADDGLPAGSRAGDGYEEYEDLKSAIRRAEEIIEEEEVI